MTTMDEVFGNSSSETVVSADDGFGEEILSDTTSSEFPDDLSEASSGNDAFYDAESFVSRNECCARASVIKSVADAVELSVFSHEFKVPLPPSAVTMSLRHTKSAAVVSKASPKVLQRPRAHSATTAPEGATALIYQNIPINSRIHPAYVNLPQKRKGDTLSSPKRRPRSAPSTPNGTHKSPRKNPSYIQLWTGSRQKRNLSESDSDEETCDKPSAAGYVRMSSPYVRSPNTSMISDLASKIASYSRIATKDCFCPFCPRPFTLESNLCHHIQTVHRKEMASVMCCQSEVPAHYCPICHTRFFNLQLLPSHLLEFHRGSIITLLDKHQCLDFDEYNSVKCPFCSKKVPISRVGEDVLLFHILQLHNDDYELLIHSLFEPSPIDIREELIKKLSTEDLSQVLSLDESATPGLSIKFKSLSCHLDQDSTNIPIGQTWNTRTIKSESQLGPECKKSKGILRSSTSLQEKPSVKRALRFSVPPVTSEEIYTPETPESSPEAKRDPPPSYNDENDDDNGNNSSFLYFNQNGGKVPIRINDLTSAEFIEMTTNRRKPCRKKRRLSLGRRSKRSKKDQIKTFDDVFDGLKGVTVTRSPDRLLMATTTSTRSFRKPIPVQPPIVPDLELQSKDGAVVSRSFVRTRATIRASRMHATSSDDEDFSPLEDMKLYAPLRMFRCNCCRIKFCDNASLKTHIKCKHKKILDILVPRFGCGICSAKFYENKYLVKHCLQHHTSLLEIKSPKSNTMRIYRFA